ncbi:hypothetical protein CQ019_08570 [Arthrobacter sp. MYb229]|uniref:nucleotidyl transferase AbiEii/AbiGii toxin family protein n=1 Tax=Micrococcaceae TaxID=1268 RepID=UPI000CFB3EC5|nr:MULTISPECIES: nucleotidyl transferase AbiEii/AbiGii toxin family protein [unclassified Arthrobacter]PRA04371.1 hypothetical protein CQ019_08570 [Arthrobacter sp. MYb229]PRB51715.1 hypothetical protein CQ013_07995 [Arthrobacter sp. MYb216]
MTKPHKIYALATSAADALGYRGQKAVAEAAEGNDYRIVGGHMVRLLLHVYPAANAVPRSTTDADTAIGSLEIAAPMIRNFLAQNFTKQGGNLFYQELAPEQRVEINLLAPRTGNAPGIRPQTVPGVGQIDTLIELAYVFNHPPLIIDVEADLGDGETLNYQTRIPNLEEALVLKAFAWSERRKDKDLADLNTLLEIREAHPEVPWRLNESNLIGFRKDTVRILQPLTGALSKKRTRFPVPEALDKLRFAALITKHCTPR